MIERHDRAPRRYLWRWRDALLSPISNTWNRPKWPLLLVRRFILSYAVRGHSCSQN